MSRAELWEPRPSWQKIDLLCAAHHKWQRVERAIPEAKRLRRVVSQASWGWEADPRSGYFYIASQLLGVLFWFNEFEFADFFFSTLPAILWLRATWFGNRESVELISSTFFSGCGHVRHPGIGCACAPGKQHPGRSEMLLWYRVETLQPCRFLPLWLWVISKPQGIYWRGRSWL